MNNTFKNNNNNNNNNNNQDYNDNENENENDNCNNDNVGGGGRCAASLRLSSLFSCFHQNIIDNDHDKMMFIAEDAKASKLIAQEIASLPAEQREKILEEVHGVYRDDCFIEESKELIEKSLQEFANEIHKMKRKKSLYDKVAFLAPHYVQNKQFRLMFLRADRFDCKKAARRFIKHFEMKQLLWGDDKLTKDITLEDFSNDDLEYYHSGSFQLIPNGDSIGRPILFISYQHMYLCKSFRTMFRVGWYYLMNIFASSEKIQRLGLVVIAYNMVGMEQQPPKEHSSVLSDCIMNMHIIRDGLPCHHAALHNCINSGLVQKFMSMLRLSVGKEWRLRFCVHYGSHLECQHSLMSYGISPDVLPVDHNGDIIIDKIEWFHREQQQRYQYNNNNNNNHNHNNNDTSTSTSTSTVIGICAMEKDVLLGRGKPFQSFPGNLKMMELVERNLVAYQNAPAAKKKKASTTKIAKNIYISGKGQEKENTTTNVVQQQQQQQQQQRTTKLDITLSVIAEIRALGGRFLQRVTITTPSSSSSIDPNITANTSSSNIGSCNNNNNNNSNVEEYWMEAGEADIIAKVSLCFRKRIKKYSTAAELAAATKVTTTTTTTARMVEMNDNSIMTKEPAVWNPLYGFLRKKNETQEEEEEDEDNNGIFMNDEQVDDDEEDEEEETNNKRFRYQ